MKSKIVFAQREMEDKLGPMVLAAYLKHYGYDARIIINPHKNIKKILEINPEFIGISFCSPSVDWALSISRFLKKILPKTLIILGGAHPTFFPQVIEQDCIDIVCIGEGEKPLLNILQKYNGELSSITDTHNLWLKEGKSIIQNSVGNLLREEELSKLPYSDRSHYQQYPLLKNNPHKKIWTSRGCPFNCSYCFNHAYKNIYKGLGKMVRQRSVDSVIDELKELKKYGWKCLEIVDDLFLLSKDWVFEFCEKYIKNVNLPFTCNSTAKNIQFDIVRALRKACCKTIYFAIESGVETIRKGIYNKNITNTDIHNAADALNSCNMPFLTFNMIGLPNETLEDIYATVEINQKIKTTYPWCSILQPYPGTQIAEVMKKQIGNNLGQKFTYSCFQSSIIDDLEKRKLINNAQKLFAYFVKSNVKYKKFVRLIMKPILNMDKLYPFVFYWNYGKDIRTRYGISWASLFRYWLYSRD